MKKRKPTGKFGLSVGNVLAVAGVLLIVLSSLFFVTKQKTETAYAATTDTLNFQGRLMSSGGNIVDDGIYNMQFSIYYQSSGGAAQWTEDRLVTNTQGVTIKNGYFSVNLGEYDAFGAIDWGNDLYLGMTVRGTGNCAWGACTPADSEMSPRLKLTSVPYAMKAGNVGSNNTNSASTNSNGVSITTGNAAGATSNSGNITIDVGTATQTAGTISIGTANTSGISIGRTGVTTTNVGALTVTQALTANGGATIVGATTINTTGTANTQIGNATGTFQLDSNTIDISSGGAISGVTGFTQASGNFVQNGAGTFSTGTGAVSLNGATTINGSQLTNTGATLNSAMTISDLPTGGNIGTAATTVDVKTTFNVNQTTAGQTLTLPSPTDTTAGRIVYVNNVGSTSFTMYGNTITAGQSNAFIWNGTSWVTVVSLGSTGVNTVGSLNGVSKNANGAVISSSTIYLQSADTTYAGLVDTTTQSFAGNKTFTDNLKATDYISFGNAVAGQCSYSALITCGTGEVVSFGSAYVNTQTNGSLYFGRLNEIEVTNNSADGAGTTFASSDYLEVNGSYDTGTSVGNSIFVGNAGSGDVQSLEGQQITVLNAGAGTVTQAIGLTISVSGATTNTGIAVGGTGIDYGINLQTADTATLWLGSDADGTTANAGIFFGQSRDTNLYRSAANTLQTDDSFVVQGNTTLGDASGDTLTINGTAVSLPNNLNFDSDTLYIDSSNDRVGIGTSSPDFKLEVVGTAPSQNNGTVLNVVATTGATSESNLSAIRGVLTVSPSGGAGGSYNGVLGNATTTSTLIPGADLFGVSGFAENAGTGAVEIISGLRGQALNSSSGTVTVASGLTIESAANSGTITTNYGIFVNPQTAGTANFGISIGTATTQTLVVGSDVNGTTANAGIAFGNSRDTNLYRSAADTLKTDDSFVIGTDLTVEGNTTIGNASTDRLTVTSQILGANPFVFQGSTDDAYVTTLSLTDPTANNTITLPDASGTVILDTTLGNTAFIQNGNSFAANAVLGTNDAYSLSFETGGNTQLTIADGGAVTFQNSTDSTSGLKVMDADGGTSILNVDTTNERVGIGTDTPDNVLEVVGAPLDEDLGSLAKFLATSTNTSNQSLNAVQGQIIANPGSASTAVYTGVVGNASSSSNNMAGATLAGLLGFSGFDGSSLSRSVGLVTQSLNYGTGTIDNTYGYLAQDVLNVGGGIITNNYGILIQPMTAGTNDYGIAVGAADTQTLWLSNNADNTTASAGIAFGSSRDTNLYRSAADTLATDDSLTVAANLSVDGQAAFGADAVLGSCAWLTCGASEVVGVSTALNSTNSSDLVFGNLTETKISNSSTRSIAGVGNAGILLLENSALNDSPINSGLFGGAYYSGTANADSIQGLYVEATNFGGSGTLDSAYGVFVGGVSGATNNYGINVSTGKEFGIAIESASTQTLWLSSNADNTTAAAGIAFGASRDTNLYRSAADVLYTDDSFGIGGNLTVGDASTDRITLTAQISGGSPIVLQGATDDSWTTTLAVADPSTNNVITLPNATGTVALVTSGSSTAGVSAFTQGGNTWAGTGTLGLVDSNTLNIITNNTTRLSINSTGSTTITGGTSGTALTVNNSTSTGNIVDFQDNGGTVLSVLDGGNLQFNTGANRTISIATQTSSNSAGNSLYLQAATGNGTGTGGNSYIYGGTGGATNGTGGAAALYGGTGVGSGTGGIVGLIGGSGGTNGAGGGVLINAGPGGSGAGNGGTVTINGGTTSVGSGGAINITGGISAGANAGGAITLQGGTGGSTGTGGAVNLVGGSGGTTGAGGAITLQGGTATGTNQAGGATTIAGGRGTGSGAGGDIVFQTATPGTSGSSVNSLTTVATFSDTEGSLTLQNAVDGANAFRILTSSSSGSSTIINTSTTRLSSYSTGTALPVALSESASFSANGYVYVIGGMNNGSATNPSPAVSTVYYAKINSDGSLGSWNTNANALPAARGGHTATYINGYVYVVGGTTARANGLGEFRLGNGTSTVYYAKVNSDGSIGSWNTTTPIGEGPSGSPAAVNRVWHSAETYNGYLYIIGGAASGGGGGSPDLMYAKVNPDGTLGSWTTQTNWMGAGRVMHDSAVVNGRVYAMGGSTAYNSLYSDTYYYGAFKSDGSVGNVSGSGSTASSASTSFSPNTLGYLRVEAVNGGLYLLSALNVTNYYIPVNNAGALGSAQAINDSGSLFARSSTTYNGYIYEFGGSTNLIQNLLGPSGDNAFTTVNYASVPRTSAGTTLDLLALQSSNYSEFGGGGTLTAGDTNVVGNLQVSGQSILNGTLTVQGNFITRSTAYLGNDVVFGTQTTTQTCAVNCTVTQTNVDNYSAVLVSASASSLVVTMPNPTSTVAGKVVYLTAANGSSDFTLRLNTGDAAQLDISMRQNTTATLIWNGSDWTAAGASSSTDLQAAYNNTLTSAGGAELVLNAAGGAADGLTIRNNATTPITGALLEVQTSIGSNLLSVNNNATEYANNGGAETSTFTMWTAAPAGGTITRYTTAGNYVATGTASTSVVTGAVASHGVRNTLSTSLTANLKYSVSFAVRGTTNFSTLDVVYSRDGTNTSTTSCATGQTVTTGKWSRVICTFTAPSSGITSSNAIFVRQSDATARTFYVDNLSVQVSADINHAVDGSVDSALSTNWTAFGTLDGLTRDTSTIYDTSGSVNVDTPNSADRGVRNNLSITPSTDTQYLVTFYARSSNTFNDIRVRYSRDGGTNFVSCTDYNTQNVSTSTWTEVTCLFTTDSTTATDADLIIDQPTASNRNFYIDALSVTLNQNTANNVQVGGANKGGPTTLFTLDRGASPPVGENNDAYLGSMYYDTVTGRIQCYEADGWGACGAAPDNIVNLNPEYAGAVLNGTGVGTMTADFCSNDTALTINSTLCSTGQAKNFYRWTSPQATSQTYSIYVTYQLPATFRGFASDDTVQLVGRVDNTTNASVTYEMFKSTGSAVTQCGTGETNVITGGGGSADTWYSYGINGNESTGCSFTSSSAGNFVIFKINMKANSNANAYVSTLSFTTNGQ